jgi:F0F1-type ATP synthase assembly protein I
MDSTTIWLVIVPLVLGVIFNAVKFMRFIGFVAGGGRRPNPRGRSYEDQMSFDERLAEKLRELDRQQN